MSNPNPYNPNKDPNASAQFGQQYPNAQGGQQIQTREDFLVNIHILFLFLSKLRRNCLYVICFDSIELPLFTRRAASDCRV